MERQKTRKLEDEIPVLNLFLDNFGVIPQSLEVLTGRNPKEILRIKVLKLVSLKTVNKKGKTDHLFYEVDTNIGRLSLKSYISNNLCEITSIDLKE